MSRRLGTPLVLAAVLAPLAACGGGPRHVAEITPAVSQRLSGAWVLNAAESDDPDEVLGQSPPAGERPQPGARGGRPGGGGMTGGRGGMPGGGAMGGRRPAGGGPGGGRLSPEAMTALRRMAVAGPRTLEISLTDSLVVISDGREEPWVLSFGEEASRKVGEKLEVKGKAEWEDGRLVFTRKLDGGAVTQTFMPSVDGRRLTVSVELSGGPRGGTEFRRVYEPRAPTGGAGR